jgi:hypothetical protein
VAHAGIDDVSNEYRLPNDLPNGPRRFAWRGITRIRYVLAWPRRPQQREDKTSD